MEQCELLYMHEGIQPTGWKLSLDLVKLRSNLHQVPFMFTVPVQALFGALCLLSFLRTHIFCISKFMALSFPDRVAVLSFPELYMVFCGVIYLSRWLLKWNPAERGRWKPMFTATEQSRADFTFRQPYPTTADSIQDTYCDISTHQT